jgi:PDZ domain-containing protein
VVAVLVLAVAASASIRVPYLALAPGSARPAERLVEVSGDVETFPADGEILFTTVSQREVTLFEALVGWRDPAVDVFAKEQLIGDQSVRQNRQLNLQLMETSERAATAVALEHLGYDVIDGEGALVNTVLEGTAADGKLAVGETVVEANGEPVEVGDDLVTAIREHDPGDEVVLRVEPVDGGQARTERVTLGDRDGTAFLGIEPVTRDVEFDFPFDVHIDAGSVGGPSAGLAFALATLDVLTPDELTGGESVAVTGSIGLRGAVGPIGGIAQKAVAVERAGVDVFIVPRANYEVARDRAGDGLRVYAVDTLADALEVLDRLGGNALALEKPSVDGAERANGTD